VLKLLKWKKLHNNRTPTDQLTIRTTSHIIPRHQSRAVTMTPILTIS